MTNIAWWPNAMWMKGKPSAANTPLLKIVKLNPITAVIFITEKEYAGLQTGQQVSLVTDAYPDRVFAGVIERIAPVFREATRQARIEVQVDNSDLQLKPGMFVRATVVLDRVDERHCHTAAGADPPG